MMVNRFFSFAINILFIFLINESELVILSSSYLGIVLSWNMSLGSKNANIASYQLFAYQETDGPVDASLWKKVGDVNALPLPMACTLTQFVDKNRYYFTVRAVDVFQRFGPFSDPVSILFEKDGENAKKEK